MFTFSVKDIRNPDRFSVFIKGRYIGLVSKFPEGWAAFKNGDCIAEECGSREIAAQVIYGTVMK